MSGRQPGDRSSAMATRNSRQVAPPTEHATSCSKCMIPRRQVVCADRVWMGLVGRTDWASGLGRPGSAVAEHPPLTASDVGGRASRAYDPGVDPQLPIGHSSGQLVGASRSFSRPPVPGTRSGPPDRYRAAARDPLRRRCTPIRIPSMGNLIDPQPSHLGSSCLPVSVVLESHHPHWNPSGLIRHFLPLPPSCHESRCKNFTAQRRS